MRLKRKNSAKVDTQTLNLRGTETEQFSKVSRDTVSSG